MYSIEDRKARIEELEDKIRHYKWSNKRDLSNIEELEKDIEERKVWIRGDLLKIEDHKRRIKEEGGNNE